MSRSLSTLFLFVFGLWAGLGAWAVPLAVSRVYGNGTESLDSNLLFARQNTGSGKPSLRIMPLGASITQGIASSPQNGYRRKLREQLRFDGYEVDMIGCQSHGDFNDRQHEGHPSMKIEHMIEFASCSIKQLPNVVLLHVGTNDCTGAKDDITITRAGDGYIRLLDYLFENIPDVTVIVSTLLPNANTLGNHYVDVLNERIRDIAVTMRQTRKVALAEMAYGYIPLTEIIDGTHPTAEGYAKMAAVWSEAIDNAHLNRLITPPRDNGRENGNDGDSQCANTPPSPGGFGPATETQRGYGHDDGTYTHSSEPAVNILKDFAFYKDENLNSALKHFHFAQLVNINNVDKGGETDELVRVVEETKKGGGLATMAIRYKLNNNGRFDGQWIDIDVKMDCLNRGIRWGDVNGDGLDDFICLSYPAGDMFVSLNRGGSPPTFENMGLIRKSEPWAKQDRIRLGDIDGDGRLDWCAIDDVGDIYCWRNGGYNDLPIDTPKEKGYWQGMVGGSYTFKAQGMPGIEGVRLIDINGDQRADWVYVYPDGHTKIFINQRGTKADGPGLRPSWVEAAVAHRGFPDEKNFSRDNVKFGRIYGTGHYDYVHHTERSEKSQPLFYHSMNVFKNTGKGGMRLKGDGVRYCDMYGRGYDDYIWIWSGGEVELFENTQDLPNWKSHGQIYNLKRDRKSVHFGDWDGDGLCDILTVEKHTGVTHMYKNTWTAGKPYPTFNDPVRVTGALCNQGWGVGLYDLGLRFADIDGDGRVDYLCMEKDGRTTGWLNTKNGLVDAKQIKFSENFDRANHRFADVNGDGKADFLWVDKFTGEVRVWLNGGPRETGGSTFFWEKQGNIWREGVDRGQNIHFPKLGFLGRADYHQVLPKTARAFTYYNTCGGAETGGDDGNIRDPNLPALPDATSEICKKDEASFINEANCKLPRVDWRKTAETCSEDQMRTIYRVQLKAIEVMKLTGTLHDAYETTGFNRYFVRTPEWKGNDYYIKQNIKTINIADWTAGPLPPKKTSQMWKITYYCKDPSWAKKAEEKCDGSKTVGAKTYNIGDADSKCEGCARIRLCPLWWKAPEIDNMDVKFPSQMQYNLEFARPWVPKEQALIHEWFHVMRWDPPPIPPTATTGLISYYIDDLKDTVRLFQDKVMYGAGLASRWAWLGFEDYEDLSHGRIQPRAMRNADNFAWMYAYNYLAARYGWDGFDDGRWKYEWLPLDQQQKEKAAGFPTTYKRSRFAR